MVSHPLSLPVVLAVVLDVYLPIFILSRFFALLVTLLFALLATLALVGSQFLMLQILLTKSLDMIPVSSLESLIAPLLLDGDLSALFLLPSASP